MSLTFCETLIGRSCDETLAQQQFAVRVSVTVTSMSFHHPYWNQSVQLLKSWMRRA